MTPQEKAQQLVDTFISIGCLFANSKKCALIAVDEILLLICAMDVKEHWQQFYEEVKTEIELL